MDVSRFVLRSEQKRAEPHAVLHITLNSVKRVRPLDQIEGFPDSLSFLSAQNFGPGLVLSGGRLEHEATLVT